MPLPPVEVTFHHLPVSDAVEARCTAEAHKLARHFDRITACFVVVSESHRRHRRGNLFEVRIRLELPGHTLVVNREPPAHHEDEDVYVAIREAFDRMDRQLEQHVDRMRGEVKSHARTASQER
jgi:ribosomal subunit interface protein